MHSNVQVFNNSVTVILIQCIYSSVIGDDPVWWMDCKRDREFCVFLIEGGGGEALFVDPVPIGPDPYSAFQDERRWI